jgi:hypothetical protein
LFESGSRTEVQFTNLAVEHSWLLTKYFGVKGREDECVLDSVATTELFLTKLFFLFELFLTDKLECTKEIEKERGEGTIFLNPQKQNLQIISNNNLSREMTEFIL